MKISALHLANTVPFPTACQIYRTNIPLEYLSREGKVSTWWGYGDQISEDFAKRGPRAWMDFVGETDVLVLPRVVCSDELLFSVSALIDLFRRMNRRVVYEVDDDLSNDYRDMSEHGILNAMRIASWCDAITVTTPILAELMRKKTKRPVYILPNMVERRTWHHNPDTELSGKLTVSLSGSHTHEGDWKVLETVLPEIAKRDDVIINIAAFHPEYLRDLPNTAYIPGMDYLSYIEFVRHSDIILAPVDPSDRFNWSKSPIKVLEGMSAARTLNGEVVGAACIGSKMPVYELAIEHEKNGLLTAHTPEGWLASINRLLDDHVLRHRLQHAGYRWVWSHHDIGKKWVLWKRAYEDILQRPPNNISLRGFSQ